MWSSKNTASKFVTERSVSFKIIIKSLLNRPKFMQSLYEKNLEILNKFKEITKKHNTIF